MSDTSKKIMVEFRNVTKTYKLYKNDMHRLWGIFLSRIPCKKKMASDNLSFTVYKGESVAFLGRNGAGKSTILKMVTKTAFPTEGEIFVNGRVSALLELTAGFDPEFTGRENIHLKGQLMGLTSEEIKAMEPDIVSFADIGDYIDQPVRTYSSGMKARLGFAVSVNSQPEILIVDEALSVGDTEFKEKCLDKIRQLIQKENVTLLFVTHAEKQAEQFCERGIYLKDGKIVYDGPIAEAINAYTQGKKKKK